MMLRNLVSFWFSFLVAIATVNWSFTIWFEWNFSFISTVGTSNFVHFSWFAVVSVVVIHFIFSPNNMLYINSKQLTQGLDFRKKLFIIIYLLKSVTLIFCFLNVYKWFSLNLAYKGILIV